MGLKSRQIPLQEFRKLITRLPSTELARLPVDRLPSHIPLEVLSNAPPDIAATLEALIFQQQSRVIHDLKSLREKLGPETVVAYDMASLPRISGPLHTLLAKLTGFQKRLRHPPPEQASTPPQALLEELEGYGGIANEVKAYYKKLLLARKSLRRPDVHYPADLAPTINKIDRKLQRRCRLHREVLSQYYSQRLILSVQMMRDFKLRLDAHRKDRQSLDVRLQKLAARLRETQNQLQRFPENVGFRHQVSRLERELESAQGHGASLAVPLGEDELQLWLDTIVDYHLLRTKSESLSRLINRAESLFLELLKHYYKIQESDYRRQHVDVPKKVGANTIISFSENSRNFLLNYFRTRQKIGAAPYWIPEITRLESLRQLEKRLIDI
jgi:hypothetical protein